MIQLQPIIQTDQLNQLASLLRLSMGGANQKETFAAIKQLEDKPQSYLYFLALLISPHFQENLRELAGLALKNMLKRNMQTLPTSTLSIVKSVIFEQYDLHQGRVLKTLGLILGLIVQQIKFDNDCIVFLLDRAQKGNIFAIETLKRIVQDCKTGSENMNMLNSQKFANLIERLIEILLPQCKGTNKEYAIDCFNMIIYPMPVSMINSLHDFLQILMVELLNPNPIVVMRTMEGFEAIASTRKDLITTQVVQLVATTNFQNQKTIKIQANFWIQVLDSDGSELIKPVLGNLLQKWIVGMILTKEDIASIMQTDRSNLQKQEDIIQDEYQQEGETAKGGEYTLRKLCGIIINKLSLLFSQQLWDESKKLVSALIQQNCWMRQELAILYIGLIADNCGEQVKQNFKEIVQTISQVMTNTTQHLLKSTCLWTLSKYTVQIVELSRLDPNVLSGYITLILNNLESQYNNVRSATCTTLTSLINQLKDNIIPWLSTILSVTSKALLTYKGNSLYCLFQFYQSLASDLSESQFSGELTQQILVPLCSKWSSLANNDRDLCPLLQSLVVLCGKTKKSIAPYAPDLYAKSMELFDSKQKQIFLRIIDLIEQIIKAAPLVVRQQVIKSDLVGKVIQQVREGNSQIKLACYSLLSILSEFVELSNPLLVMSEIFNSINSKKQSQVNNALFCMAELIKNYPQITEFAEPSVKLAIQFLLKAGGSQRNVYFINFSKVIGLIAAVHPHKIAPHLKVFFKDFCRAIRASNQHNPKLHQAVLGVIKMIQLNPEAALEDFKYFAEMGVCLRNPPEQNTLAFKHLLKLYKDRLGSQNWEIFLNDSYFLPGAVNKIQQYVR